ncbi:MAG: Serine/threonine-protein kinase PrkC [Planctomycetota bacterium]
MSESDPEQKPKPSTRVTQLGDFELRRELGQGGMGRVYLARQTSLDRLVAIKTLSRELAKKPDFVTRFEREARAMAKIDHPNVVKIYAVDSFQGIHFAAIEYIDGRSIQKELDERGRLSVGDALHVAIICAEALRHAHLENMIHRDIKPDNILVTRRGVVKVADFGLAKAVDEDVSMTQSGTGLGTPLYMAPEQARNAKHVDQRVDIYALGATLYHMLTGKLPFTGRTTLEVIMAKEKGACASARSLRPEVPEKLDLILDRMLAKDPKHRYGNCEELLKDLTSLGLHSESLSFIEGGAGVAAATPGSPLTSVSQSRRSPIPAPTPVRDTSLQQTARVWFVQFEDGKGNTVVEKLSTSRVLKMLTSGQLTAKARAKASADGTYYPLAQFPEFAKAVEDSLARNAAAIRKEEMQNLYSRVDRDQRMFQLKRKFKNFFVAIRGIASLIVLLLVLLGAGWLLYQYGSQMPAKLAEMVGFGEKSTPEPESPEFSVEGGLVPEGATKQR